MAVKKSIPKTTIKNTFNIRETFTQHRRLIIWIICLIVLAVLLWFVFRGVKTYQAENKAERELLMKQREEAKRALEEREKEAFRIQDSLMMELLGIRTNVEYKIKWRTEYVTRFIDTASVATKFKYIDSLAGPR